MKKYYRFIFYSVSGFLFITVYLICVFLTRNKVELESNTKLRRKKTTETEEPTFSPEILKEETLQLLEDKVVTLPRDPRGRGSSSRHSFLLHWRITSRETETTNVHRLQKIGEVCRKYNLGLYKTSENKTLEHPPVPQYSVFFFDRKHKLSFCPIYKAGSSTWLYNLLLLTGMKEDKIKNSKKQLSELAREHYPELGPDAAEEALTNSIKIMTVRHPFERILSAYRDKLENTNVGREHGTLHFYKTYGSKIVKKYRKGGNNTKVWDILKASQYLWDPEKPKPAGVEPTFREFVQYLLNSNLVQKADDHWIPYYLFCTPCLLRYDIVAKVETMDLDQMYSIQILGLQNVIKPTWRHKTQFTEENFKDTVSFLSRFYFRQLSVEEIKSLYEKYKVDFELFGYDYTDYLKYAYDY